MNDKTEQGASPSIRLESDLSALIDSAVKRTGLSKSELLRQGLRKGIPAVTRSQGWILATRNTNDFPFVQIINPFEAAS